MVTVNKKWLQLMGIVGCAIGFASCGQTQKGEMQTGGYETMVVAKADKVVETYHAAGIRYNTEIMCNRR